jgi:hypothetical protein
MQVLLDNIVASIVGAVILLMMLAVQQRNQLASAEATSFYMLQQHVLDFTSTLQRDMQNVTAVLDLKEDESNLTFRFLAQVSPTDTTKRLVSYKRVKVRLRERGGVQIPLYQIERYVDGNMSGASMQSITAWAVRGLNEEGNPAGTPGDVKQILVRMDVASPVEVLSDEDKIDATRWEATFRPRMLRGNSI